MNESCSESEVKEDDDLESCKDPPKVVQAEKKKRKRKKKTGKKLAVASSEDNIDLKADHDDIDETVRWVEANEAPAVKATSLLNKEDTEVATVAARKVLLVENKHLNPENEMKRIFGSRVVASENTRHKKGNLVAHCTCSDRMTLHRRPRGAGRSPGAPPRHAAGHAQAHLAERVQDRSVVTRMVPPFSSR